MGLLQVGDLVFEVTNAGGGGLQAFFLQDDGLGQQIGRIGLLAHGGFDETFGVAVARGIGGGAAALEKGCEQLAFFG